MKPIDVTIVGAGITGLAAAIALRRDGHRVVVYERFAQSKPIGAGLMIQPTGLAALQRLGLRSEIEARGARIERLFGDTTDGQTIFNLSYDYLGPEYYAVGVYRAALHGVLWRAFVACGAALETNAEITEADTTGSGAKALVDAVGRRYPGGQLVIDASGARSKLAAALTRRRSRPYQYGAVWTTVPDIVFQPGALSQRYERARRMMGYLPIGGLEPGDPPLAALFWSLRQENFDAWARQFGAWRDAARVFWPALEDVIDALDGPEMFAPAVYEQATLQPPYQDGIVFAGDAAHSTSPQLGQGANQGIIDAVVLADALRDGITVDGAVQNYAAMRRAHVRFYQLASAVMTPMFQSDQFMLPWLRDLTFDRMRLVPYLHREMLRTLCGMKTGVFSWRDPEQLVQPGR